jgi:hypothetical protein
MLRDGVAESGPVPRLELERLRYAGRNSDGDVVHPQLQGLKRVHAIHIPELWLIEAANLDGTAPIPAASQLPRDAKAHNHPVSGMSPTL